MKYGLIAAAVMAAGGWIAADVQAQLGAPRDLFFAPAQMAGEDLDPDNVFPMGRKFPLSFFSVGGDMRGPGGMYEAVPEARKQEIMSRIAADGFTMIGPQYELNDRILQDARDHGLKAAYSIAPRTEEGERMHLADLPEGDMDDMIEQVRQQVKAVVESEDNDLVGWWYIQPEELRYWRDVEIEFLERGANAIRESDPEGRPVWMYDPGHRGANGLAYTAAHLDIVGKGMYTNYSSMFDQRVWCRWTIEQQNEAIQDANPSAISIAVPEMFRHPGNYVEAYIEDEDAAAATIEKWVRHDAYASLVAGAQGMIIFSLRERPGNPETGSLPFRGQIHEAYYQAYADVARELTGDLSLGDVFLFGEWRDDLSVEIVRGPSTLTMTYRNNDPVEYPAISLANIAVDRDRYVILVNSADENVSAIVTGLPYGDDINVRDLFTGRTFTLGEGEIEASFEPYEVRAFRIEYPH